MKMKKAAISGLFALTVACGAQAGALILSPEDGRVWQTVFNPSAPLEWRWEDSAVSAAVIVSNLLSGANATTTVQRVSGTTYGSYALDYAAGAVSCGEALYDVVLVQLGEGENVLDTQTSRLSYLPAAFTVDTKRLGRLESRRLVAYDAAWTNVTKNAMSSAFTFTPERGAAVEVELGGSGGYFAIGAVAGVLELKFDGQDATWTAGIAPRRGFAFAIR